MFYSPVVINISFLQVTLLFSSFPGKSAVFAFMVSGQLNGYMLVPICSDSLSCLKKGLKTGTICLGKEEVIRKVEELACWYQQ